MRPFRRSSFLRGQRHAESIQAPERHGAGKRLVVRDPTGTDTQLAYIPAPMGPEHSSYSNFNPEPTPAPLV